MVNVTVRSWSLHGCQGVSLLLNLSETRLCWCEMGHIFPLFHQIHWLMYLFTFSVRLYEPLYYYTGPTWSSGFQKRRHYGFVLSLKNDLLQFEPVVFLRAGFRRVPSLEAHWFRALFKLWWFYSVGLVCLGRWDWCHSILYKRGT